jgi:hypothetical protein
MKKKANKHNDMQMNNNNSSSNKQTLGLVKQSSEGLNPFKPRRID